MSFPPHQSINTQQGSELINQSTTQSSIHPNISDPIIEGLISIASTSSSSSSSSSSGGSFDLLAELNNTQEKYNISPTLKPEVELPVSTNPPPVQDFTKQSPPVQTMGRPNNISGYDPNRIPSSIFASKPASQADWSVTSNESLFSIHMGNNSFSRDHAILLGKSEEFYKFDDLISNVPSQQPKQNDVSNSPYNLPTVIERTSDVENHRPSVSVEEGSSLRKEANVKPKTVFLNNNSNISEGRETPTRDGTRTSASTNRCSTESGTNSSSSFAFPVFMGEAGNNPPPVKAVYSTYEHVQHRHVEKPKRESHSEPHRPTPKDTGTRWFSWTWFCWFRTFTVPRCSVCCR